MLQQIKADSVYVSVDQLVSLKQVGKELSLSRKRKSRSILGGISRTRYRGRGMEFSEVRPYQPGDDIRTIDWRVTARTQTPYTKLFQEERERPIFIVVDQRSPMFFGSQSVFKSVYAAQIAATIGWAAHTNNDRIGALVFSDHSQGDSRTRRGKNALLDVLHQIAQFNHLLENPVPQEGGTSLEEMLAEVQRVARPGSAVFIISDCHDLNETINEPLTRLSKHSDVTLFHVYDALEKHFPKNGDLTLSNTKSKLTVDAKKVRQPFHQYFVEKQKQIAQVCTLAGVDAIDAPVQASPESLLLSIYSKNNRVTKSHLIGQS